MTRSALLLVALGACAAPPRPPPPAPPAAPPPAASAAVPKAAVVVSGSVEPVFPALHFPANDAKLAPEYDATIASLARSIHDDPEQLGVVALVGHAEAHEPRAYQLSAERADAVAAALRQRGVADARLRTARYGAWCPQDPADTPEARDANRRVEIRVLRSARGDTGAALGCDAARLLPRAKPSARAGKAKPLDTSDWTTAAKNAELSLVWTVDQSKAQPPLRAGDVDDDRTKHDVPFDLTLTVEGHAHSLALHTNGGVTAVGACSGVNFFWAGLLVQFRLQRLATGRVLLTHTVGGEASADVTTALSVFDAPAEARVSQTLVTIAEDGTRTTEACLGSVRP